MSHHTNIQWCHSSSNPIMGCDGCELWAKAGKIIADMATKLQSSGFTSLSLQELRETISAVISDRKTSEIYAERNKIARNVCKRLGLDPSLQKVLVDVVRESAKCYAGLLGTNRAGHPGYADQFEVPKLFPGRMAEAARWSPPTDKERAAKPWLLNAPRMIFVSDMGDALSSGVPFEYLRHEIVNAVVSENGRRHLWLWLTKRPGRMAEFGKWLQTHGISWPDNLVAMTTVTSAKTVGRVRELLQVPSKFKGLSCEPLYTELNFDLAGVDWLIVGGGSDALAEPFHVEFALSLSEQCRKTETAFFLKQLGKNPLFNGKPLNLDHLHGGNWSEWPEAWRIREIPAGFPKYNAE